MNGRRTSFPAAVAVALAGTIVLAQGPPAPQAPETPRFRAAANVVVVEATVVDRDGDVVKALGADDFKVEVDGKHYVYLVTGDTGYQRHEVKVANVSGDQVRVLEGLSQGQRIVVKGAVLIKGQELKG